MKPVNAIANRAPSKLEMLLGEDLPTPVQRPSRSIADGTNEPLANRRPKDKPTKPGALADDEGDGDASPEQPEAKARGKVSRRDQRRVLEREMDSPIMSVEEAAAYLRLSKQTVYDDASRDEIPNIRRGKRILIVKPLLDEMILSEARERWKAAPPSPSSTTCPNCGKS